MELNNSEKVNSLISLYNHVYEETKRYRNHVWQILVWTVGLLAGVLAVARYDKNLVSNEIGKCLGIVFVLVVAVFGAWNIYFDYYWFVRNRRVLRTLECKLQFHKKDTYGEGAILDKSWTTKKYTLKKCLPHLIQWYFVILAVTVYSVYTLWIS